MDELFDNAEEHDIVVT